MDFCSQRNTGCPSAFCCTYKRDLIKNNNFVKTIEIIPRVILFQKLKINNTYCQTITVRNTGSLSRNLEFISGVNSEIKFQINGNTELQPGAFVSVDIYLEPTKRRPINRSRYFFVKAEHPDIVWEIPIIVKSDADVHVPELICLPKVPQNTISYYQLVVYNPLRNETLFSICTNSDDISTNPISETVLAKDYSNILITGKTPSQPVTTSVILTLSKGKSFKILVQMEPSTQFVYIHSKDLNLEDTYMGLKSDKVIQVCNKSSENVSFQWFNSEVIKDESDGDGKNDDELIVSEFLTIRNNRGFIPPMSSITSLINFFPSQDFKYNEDDDSPFQVNTDVHLFSPIRGPQSYRVHITGQVLGPDIRITTDDIDVGNIHMGQIQCNSLNFINQGPIPGFIYFKGHTSPEEIKCSVNPSSADLSPGSESSFQLNFYRRDVGKFLTKLTFKIKSGCFVTLLLRGNSIPSKVKVYPDIFEFGDVPICIPQKRVASIFNPLPVPVVVEPKVIDDGVEDPLILCVDHSNLPLHTRDKTFLNIDSNKSKCKAVDEGEMHQPSFSDFDSGKRASTITDMSSQISSMFQNKVLDDIPAIAKELLENFKTNFPQDQTASAISIIDAALDCVIDRTDYFHDIKDKQNFLQMNWNSLPCDAKEVAIEVERIYLEPNESRTFSLVLVPNSVGPSLKTIQLRTYSVPISAEDSDLYDTLDCKAMVNTLGLQYNCVVPVLKYSEDVKFSHPLYVYKESPFFIKFKNIGGVPGFVHFNVTPNSEDGIIQVCKTQQKLFVAPDAEIKVSCSVIFHKVGTVALHGIFHLIGKQLEFPFQVEAKVLPPKVQVYPEKISAVQQVLVETKMNLFIENICPTVAQFSVSLNHEKYQYLEPLGGGLAPRQKVLISIHSKFMDPGIYKNAVNIYLRHTEMISIPLTFIVKGAPLKFEPNIKQGLDFGIMSRRSSIQNHPIQIVNWGRKSYRLLFQKKKTKTVMSLPVSIFSFEPNGLNFLPKAQGTVHVQIDTSREGQFEEEFSVDGVGEDNCRFKFFSFTAKCLVSQSKILWSKSKIFLEKGNSIESADKIIDSVSLINTTQLVANVSLDVVGCFCINLANDDSKQTSLKFVISEKAEKEIVITLNETAIEFPDLMCQCFEGSIKCKVNNKTQKSLTLYAKIVNPGLRICTPKVTFFTPHAESFAHIELHNCSPLKATFNWKQISSTLRTSDRKCDESYGKTLSEIVLNLCDEDVPSLPVSIEPSPNDVSPANEESSEDDVPSHRTTIVSPNSLKKKGKSPWSASSKISSIGSSSLLTAQSSHHKLTQSMSCKPLEYPRVDKTPIHVKDIFKFLGLSSQESNNNLDTDCGFNKSNTIGDVKCEEEFKEENSVVFQQKSGTILPECTHKAYLFLPILKEGETLTSKYSLEVVNGRSEILDLTVTRQKARIHVSQTYVDLGKEIWHKHMTSNIKITSLSLFTLKVTVIEEEEKQRFTTSHIKIVSPKQFLLPPQTSTHIEYKVLFGFNPNFTFDIGLEINNNATAIPIRFNGSGQVPIIVCRNLLRATQTSKDIVASYLLLQLIFNNLQTKKNETTASTTNSERKTLSKRRQWDEFVVINVDEGSLKAEDIEIELEIQRFLSNLEESNELQTALDKFHARCIQFGMMQLDPIISLKMTICCPIPWEMSAYNLDMGLLCFDEPKSFVLDILFVGPGRLFLSAKTRTIIPGLAAEFEVSNGNGDPKSFVFFQSSKEKTPCKYKNMHKRNNSLQINEIGEPMNSYNAHLIYTDESPINNKKISSTEYNQKLESKNIKDRYTKFNQTFKQKKNPLILTEICQTTEEQLSGSSVQLNLKFIATREFYNSDEIIEDFLLIDVHLGPTLPIILRGKTTTS